MFFLILDIGQDGTGLEANARFGRDAAALMLQYYDGDYTPVAGTGNFNLFSADAVGLYNGNIAALSTATYSMMPLLKLFRYDKLNRIKRMQTAGISAGEWGSPTDNFSTEYRYDYNGNILSLQRKDATAQIMHHINYAYNAKNNRLQAITAVGINSSSYGYDAIGNLIEDSGEDINIIWNAANKVKTVTTSNNNLSFSYSPTGQRQIKKTGDKTEYYLHDATGNIMCIYELSGNYLTVKERTIYGSKRIGVYRQRIRFGYSGIVGGVVIAPGSDLVNVLHPQPVISPDGRHYLEGSNRLQVIGVARTTLSVNTLPYAYKEGTVELKGLSPSIAARPTFLDGTKTAGLRDYELTDHLSNVMAVISDRKLSVDTNSDTITDYYEPQVVSYTDYYPFGFPMAERSGNLAGYRFGFNGKEADNEIYGAKTTYAFEYRMQDTRLGRFWSVDPLAGDYPWNSAYAFAENRAIDGIDLEGLEYLDANKSRVEFVRGELHLKISNFLWINRKQWEALSATTQNWTINPINGKREIGVSTLRARLNFGIPSPPMARMGTPGQQQYSNRIPIEGPPSPSGYTSVAGTSSGSATMAKGILILDIINISAQVYMGYAQIYDNKKIKEHTDIAKQVIKDINQARTKNMIPIKYDNPIDLGNIMNVVLQGENNTNNPEIYKLGMYIYNKISKPQIENK